LDRENSSLREQMNIYAPAMLLALLGFVLAYQFVDPAPARTITIAAGQKDGAYALFAERYREILQREDVELKIINSAGSLENMQLLKQGKAKTAFIQSGTTMAASDELQSLGSLFFEPIWVFHSNSLDLTRLSQLQGKSIAIGAEGSGTKPLALQLLQDNAIDATNAQLLSMSSEQSANQLLQGELDAIFLVASPHSSTVSRLLSSDRVKLMAFERAKAYTSRHKFLSSVTLPQGVIDMQRNIPDRDLNLLAASANLIGHSNLHPAHIDLLLQAATEVHGGGGWFEQNGEFPSSAYLELPLGKEARRFYDYGPPFLQRYLPFWAASLVDRLKVMLLPLIALLLPLFKIMPPLYRWRMRSRVYRWYDDLLKIDRLSHTTTDAATIQRCLSELDEIEQGISDTNVPLSFAEELYDLRLHLNMVRGRLKDMVIGGSKTAPGAHRF